MIFRQLFNLILFCHFSSYCFSLTTEKNCEKQEKYIETTTVERYTWKEVNVTVLITEFCRGIPFPIGPKCSKVVLKTVLKRYPAVDVIQITKIRTIRTCCAGYDEIPLINQCQPICETSCQNGGECVAPNTCNCTQQFIGDTCEQDFNECASNFDNCEHTCTNLFGSYECGCGIGYYLSTDGYSCPENTVRITDLIINSQNGITVRLDWSLQFAHELVEGENPIKTIVINSYKNNSETMLDSIMVAINETNLTLAFLDFNTTYIFELQVISVLDIITFRKVSYTTSPQDFLCINYKMHNSINPCGIGGVCLDTPGDSSQYICECKPGYIGTNCEHDIDECLDQICYNGGTCIDGINEYFCLCASSYEGIDCSTLKPICDSNPCFNNGNCTSTVINNTHQIYSCDCPLGFTGDHCQVVDYCAEVNCKNGAQCSSLGDMFVCNCTPNYSGLYCEFIDNPCYDDPCINGECHIMSATNQAYCACSRFHYGSRCHHTCLDSYGSLCACDSINSCKNYCENETDAVYGIEWANFPINTTSLVSCSVLNTSYSGFISRKCDQFGDWQLINTTDCVYIPDPEFNCAFTKSLSKLLLNYTTDLVSSKSDNMTLNAVLLSLLTSTSTIANLSVELRCSSTIQKQIIQIFSNILQSSIQMETINDIEYLLSSLEQSISPFRGIYDTIYTDGLLLEGEYIDYVNTIISTTRRREEELEVIRIDLPQSSIHIPQHYVRIPLSLISQLDLEGNRVGIAVIKSSQAMLARRIDIISINISSSENSDRFHNFLPPITLTFYAKTAIPADMTCVFLNTKGEWVNEGVTTSLLSKESVTCEVSHLGSFTAIPFDQVSATSAVVFNSTTIQQPHSINQTNSPNIEDSEIANVLFIIEVILFILSFTIICVLAITFVLHSFFRLSNKEKRNTFKKTYRFYIVLLHFSVANTCVLILLNINIILDIVFIRNAIVCMTIQSLIYFILLVSISYDLVSTIHCLICLVSSNTQKIFNHPMLNFLTLTLISLGISITLFVPLIGGFSNTYFQEFNRIQPLRCSHFISKELFLGFSSLCSLLLLVTLAAVISCIILYKKNHTAIESKRIKYIKLILFYLIMIPSKIVYFLLLSLIIATLSDVKYGCTVFYSLILTMIIYLLSMYILTDKLIKNNKLITPKMKIPQHHEPHFNTYNKNKREYSVDCIDDSSLPNITVVSLSHSNSMQMNEPEFENQNNDTLYSSNCYIIPLDKHLQLRNLSQNQIIDPPAYQDIEMTNNSLYDMVGELSPISLTQYDAEFEIHGKQTRESRSGEYKYMYHDEYCKDDLHHFNKENNIRSNSCSDLNLIQKIKPINPNETPFVIQKYMRLDSVSSEHIYFQSMPDLSEKIKDSVFRKSTGEITFSSEKIFKIDKKDNQKQENSFQTIREKYDNVL